jgi:hypothetical protein
MVFLLADTLILTFITLNLGIITRELLTRIFRTPLHADLLELFLLGLLFSSFYFNVVSFFRGVDYKTLLPLFILSLAVIFFYRQKAHAVWRSIRDNVVFFFSRRRWLVATIVAVVIFVYWILPCGTEDSVIYHFQSILWYEKFKVVPGLANLNGRLGFNPASFLIESAYSFSGPARQAIYPLNGIACGLLFSWLLLRVFRNGRSLVSLLYVALIVLIYRHTLIDITSPSSDGMSAVCMVYVLIRLGEYSLSPEKSLATAILPTLVVLYGIIIKPATFAILPALLYFFFTLPRAQRKTSLLFKIAAFGVLLYGPWLARNYILTGYLLFPFSATGWFHPDWKVSMDAVKMEINYIHLIPKLDNAWTPDWSAAAVARGRSLFGWLRHWINNGIRMHPMDLVFLLLALLSPLYWLIRLRWRKDRSPLLLPWAIAFVATLMWMEASPVFRFGVIYIYMSFMLPLFDLAVVVLPKKPPAAIPAHLLPRFYPALLLLTLVLAGTYYVYTGFTRLSSAGFSFTGCWLRPLPCRWSSNRQKIDFPYRTLKDGTKLYVADSYHHCINTCLPCMEFNYGEVEMRGASLDDGFRIIKDEVKLHYGDFVQ